VPVVFSTCTHTNTHTHTHTHARTHTHSNTHTHTQTHTHTHTHMQPQLHAPKPNSMQHQAQGQLAKSGTEAAGRPTQALQGQQRNPQSGQHPRSSTEVAAQATQQVHGQQQDRQAQHMLPEQLLASRSGKSKGVSQSDLGTHAVNVSSSTGRPLHHTTSDTKESKRADGFASNTSGSSAPNRSTQTISIPTSTTTTTTTTTMFNPTISRSPPPLTRPTRPLEPPHDTGTSPTSSPSAPLPFKPSTSTPTMRPLTSTHPISSPRARGRQGVQGEEAQGSTQVGYVSNGLVTYI